MSVKEKQAHAKARCGCDSFLCAGVRLSCSHRTILPPQPLFPADELDNLLAPVALYPDPLLAQILIAATFPDQIDEAAQFCRNDPDPGDIDVQVWDVSVKALAHYPTVLNKLTSHLDWAAALGEAYVTQPDDVMDSIQRLRQEAMDAGNLVDTPEQEVIVDGDDIEIWPAQDEYIYVPMYDPSLAYFGSGGRFDGPVVSFGPPQVIGAWLNHDCGWRDRRIHYHGWSTGNGWVGRSRPYVYISDVYVNDSYRSVPVNGSVVSRTLNSANLTRYHSVHRELPRSGSIEPQSPDPVEPRNITGASRATEPLSALRSGLMNSFTAPPAPHGVPHESTPHAQPVQPSVPHEVHSAPPPVQHEFRPAPPARY